MVGRARLDFLKSKATLSGSTGILAVLPFFPQTDPSIDTRQATCSCLNRGGPPAIAHTTNTGPYGPGPP